MLHLQEAASSLALYLFPEVTAKSSSLKKGVAQGQCEPSRPFQALATALTLFSAMTHITLHDGAQHSHSAPRLQAAADKVGHNACHVHFLAHQLTLHTLPPLQKSVSDESKRKWYYQRDDSPKSSQIYIKSKSYPKHSSSANSSNYTQYTSQLMAVHQLRTAALENRPDPQEEKVNLRGGRKRRSRMSWPKMPVRAEGGGARRGVCVLGVGMTVNANRKEKQWKARRRWSWAGQRKEWKSKENG